jgi:hypothetical protein
MLLNDAAETLEFNSIDSLDQVDAESKDFITLA